MKQMVNDLVYKNIAKPGAHVKATPLSEEDPDKFTTEENEKESDEFSIKINPKPLQVNSKKAVAFFVGIFAAVIISNIVIFAIVFSVI